MRTKSHIIDKVFVEIDTSNEEEAYVLKDNLGNFLKAHVFQELERVFDEHSREDLITRFDRLEIELSVTEPGNLNMLRSEIVKQVAQKIELAHLISGVEFNGNSYHDYSQSNNDPGNQIEEIENRQAVFLFFLENGFLPWYAHRVQLQNLFEVNEWNLQLENSVFLSKLKHLLIRSENAVQRMIFQVPMSNILNLIVKIGKINLKDRKAFETYLNSISGEEKDRWLKLLTVLSFDKRDWRKEWYQLAQLDEDVKKLNFKTIKNRVSKIETTAGKYFSDVNTKQYFTANEKEIKEFLMMFDTEKFDEHAERGQTQKVPTTENDPTIISHGSNVELKKEPLFFERDAGDIAVRNAGQVLFSPFIPALFRHFNWLDDTQKIDNEHRHEAIQTLHFCATGKTDFFEADMILEKYLCGIPLKESVPKASLLNDEIKVEANRMLHEIIKNWPALKNTSIDGLRQMFIQRDGKLIKKDRGFKLIVERKAQDVLLEKLPWGISVVKLPWIKEILFVEW